MAFSLEDFITESNRIEGMGPAQPHEIEAHKHLLEGYAVTVGSLCAFVKTIAGVDLRDQSGMNVRVGHHVPPRGGPHITAELERILDLNRRWSPFEQHMAYETLHPFMDGNGRSGRALWLHAMGGIERAPLGFLHHFYYQSLDGWRA